MQTSSIAIVGGGLSGLYAAFLLEQRGVDYQLFEARQWLGGRIASGLVDRADTLNRFDLGPTWYWPELQPDLAALIQSLQLKTFAQYETGDMLIERSPHTPPTRTRGYVNSPASMRLEGGMASLIDALYAQVNAGRIHLNHQLTGLEYGDNASDLPVKLTLQTAAGETREWQAEQVLLAIPPRQVMAHVHFQPGLPPTLAGQWQATATWMAPHAKYVAVFDQPFWRSEGLSGEARSYQGPMVEIHDAAMPGGLAALFGFLGVPAPVRAGVDETTLRQHCRAQLVRLFGEQATQPRHEFFKDWAQDSLIAAVEDANGSGDHPVAPAATPASGIWHKRVMGIASEWSLQFSGYLAGAIEAAARGVQASFLKEPL